MTRCAERTRVLLVRHGATSWTERGRHQGRGGDVSLSPEGREQAERTAATLAPRLLAAVLSSPLRRAMETAEVVAAPHGLSPTPVRAFAEVDLGAWEGLTADEAAARAADLYPLWRRNPAAVRPPGGETLAEAAARAVPAFRECVAQHAGRTIAVVGHSLIIRILLCEALGAGLDAVGHVRCRPGSIAVVDVRGDHTSVRQLNDTCHLR